MDGEIVLEELLNESIRSCVKYIFDSYMEQEYSIALLEAAKREGICISRKEACEAFRATVGCNSFVDLGY